ncbi:MAG: shikimate dehydrogenase [Lachnospiraceae bacterium]|nr:shikimate dehydrogenase [Lachnospiraceae bacterium]
MQYGLIGEKLGHSISAEIHGKIGLYPYELCEIPQDGLDAFMRAKDFRGINVTIPYKERVIQYLDSIDERAAAIGAVNTIVNRDGKLYGYNTDFIGLKNLMRSEGHDYSGSTILILGTGGTSKTARAVCASLGAEVIKNVSRSGRDGAGTYEEAYKNFRDADYIINATPVGMFPKTDACPVELDRFHGLKGVIDVIANPRETLLMKQAREKGIPAVGGLRMLVRQAVAAAEYFSGEKIDEEKAEEITRYFLERE